MRPRVESGLPDGYAISRKGMRNESGWDVATQPVDALQTPTTGGQYVKKGKKVTLDTGDGFVEIRR